MDIASLRKAFQNGMLDRISWVPSRLQHADAPTKDNGEESALVDCTLSDGAFRDNYGDTLMIRNNESKRNEV